MSLTLLRKPPMLALIGLVFLLLILIAFAFISSTVWDIVWHAVASGMPYNGIFHHAVAGGMPYNGPPHYS